jgi:hypothetical protein
MSIFKIVSNDVKHNISSLTLFSSSCQRQCDTKTGHHDIAEILLKVALNTKNQINQLLMD